MAAVPNVTSLTGTALPVASCSGPPNRERGNGEGKERRKEMRNEREMER